MIKKKKSNKGVIVIIILIIALLGISGYIIYDKAINKEEPGKEKKEPEIKEVTEEEKNTLLEQINVYTPYFADSYPITEKSTLDNQEVLYFASMQLENKFSDFMESDLEKVLEKYFGKDHPYVHEDIDCFAGDGVLYKYDSAKRTYEYEDMHAHGGKTIYRSTVFFVEGKSEDDTTYKIQTQILYTTSAGDTVGPRDRYYTSANQEYDDYILGPYGEDHEVTEEEYQSIKNKIPITTFTFEKDEDNNYGLKSVTIA